VALSAFHDRKAAPNPQDLARVLGKAAPLWVRVKDDVSVEFAPVEEDWSFAGAKYGWSLRLKRGKRVVLYMTPGMGHFLASFALGEKACTAARDAGLPPWLLALIADAPKYVEGRGVRIPVRTRREARAVVNLAGIKLAN
jgi:hypothetical protein